MIEKPKTERINNVSQSRNEIFLEQIIENPHNMLSHIRDLSQETKLKVDDAISEIKNIFNNYHINYILSGSLAINEYLPTSDCDINLIIPNLNPNDEIKIKKLLQRRVPSLDLYIYNDFDDFESLANYSVMEYNKLNNGVFNDQFIQDQIQTDLFNQDNYITDFIFEYHYFYNYKNYKSFDQEGFDFKYDYGNIRDCLLINTIGAIEGITTHDNQKPMIESTINELYELKMISEAALSQFYSSINLLFLVKVLFGLQLNRSDKSTSKINTFSLYRMFETYKPVFSKLGLTEYHIFEKKYYDAKKNNSNFVSNYYKKISSNLNLETNQNKRWVIYEKNYQKITNCKDENILNEITLEILEGDFSKWENIIILLQNRYLKSKTLNLKLDYCLLNTEYNKFLLAQIKKHPSYESK